MDGDILDFTLLKKKGLLKVKEDIAPDVIDLRPQGGEDPGGSAVSRSSEQVSPFDMLNNLASAGSSDSSLSADTSNNEIDLKLNRDFSSLMSRVDNLEYQLDRIKEKFSSIEERIDALIRNVR